MDRGVIIPVDMGARGEPVSYGDTRRMGVETTGTPVIMGRPVIGKSTGSFVVSFNRRL